MSTKRLAALVPVFAILSLTACGAERESIPLSYPGDARTTAEPIGAAIEKHGFVPICKTRTYCKFDYQGKGTVHFKLKRSGLSMVVDVPNASDMPPADAQKLIAEMNRAGREIWDDARPDALAREEAARKEAEEARRRQEQRDADARAARDAAEAERNAELEKQRQADEAAKAEADRQAALQVWETISFENHRGSAFQFVAPEGATCRIEGDASWVEPKQLEVPFQVPAARDTYYTFDCQLSNEVSWRKKLQAKADRVTVVRLTQGGPPEGASAAN